MRLLLVSIATSALVAVLTGCVPLMDGSAGPAPSAVRAPASADGTFLPFVGSATKNAPPIKPSDTLGGGPTI